MTDPFMRVDVSQASRDFQPVALEPGLPLLDRSNSNGQILRKWFGELLAEPDRVGDDVGFYVRDHESRRIDSVFCVPISEKDLAGDLSTDFKELRRRKDAAKPQTPNEQLIHRIVDEQLGNITNENNSRDRSTCLFKFRDGRNKWHLVWAPGYRRRDNEPATTQVCSKPSCLHLFLQRHDTSGRCPVCQSVRRPSSVENSPRSFARTFSRFVALLLIVALGAGAAIWWQHQQDRQVINDAKPPVVEPLTVEPAQWTGPVGSQVQFVVNRREGESTEEVTSSAAVMVANPKVFSVKPFENTGKALFPGTTELTFFVGTLKVQTTVKVEPRTKPTKLTLQPETVNLGVGTTEQVKLIGEFEQGQPVDLTDDAEWESNQDPRFFVQKGQIEGEEAGIGTLRVRYHFDELSPPMEASAEVVIRDYKYKDLKLTVAPNPIKAGKPARADVVVASDDGTRLPVNDSKDLTIDIAPAERGSAHGSELTFTSEGDVKITAQFRGLTSSLDLKVVMPGDLPQSLEVSPKRLDLKVGEVARLNIVSARMQDIRLTSSDAEIAEVGSTGAIIGRGVGDAKIEVSDGGEPITIAISVTAAEWNSIAIEPLRISIRPNETATLRVFGLFDESNRAELASDQVTWSVLPNPDFADFDKSKMQLTGLKPTGSRSERLVAQINTFQASADVEVVAAPLLLKLSPEGSLEIPVGQKRSLQVWMQSGGSAPLKVAADDVEWKLSSEIDLPIRNGEIHATREGDQVRLTAKYQGAISNEIRVTTVAATPLTLQAVANPSSLPAGGTGTVTVTATGPGGAVALSEDGLAFLSSAPAIEIMPTTGVFRAIAPGEATIHVSHTSAKQPVEVRVTVSDVSQNNVTLKPAALRFVSPQGETVRLPVGAEYSDWKVEAVAQDGSVSDVSEKVTLVIEGDSTKSTLSKLLENSPGLPELKVNSDPQMLAVVIRNRRIVAVRPGQAIVHAIFGGISTTKGLQVDVVDGLDVDEIRLSQREIRLIVGESAHLTAEGFKGGKSVGDITNHGGLVWNSGNRELVLTDGPQVNAKKAGAATVTVSCGAVTSKPSNVSVVVADGHGNAPVEVGRLVVVPSRLKMKIGEVATLGQEIVVKRQAVDFSNTCEVAAPESRLVTYDETSRTIRATAPGRTQMTFVVRDQAATLDIETEPEVIPASNSSIIIEPSAGQLAIGEELPLRVFVVTQDGTRSPAIAALTSSKPDTAAISGSSVRGIAVGDVTVEARIPGIDQAGKAVFAVGAVDFERLVFMPASLTVGVGQKKSFAVYAITKNGRVKLGDDPKLKIFLDHPDGTKEDLPESNRFEVVGLNPGRDTLVATWNGKLEQRIPVIVEEDHVTELVIKPDNSSVTVGESVDYQVFARREGRLQPLKSIDGVELSVANPVVATAKDFRLTGLKAGKTQVIVTNGTDRAVAQLKVVPRTQPVAPPATAERLRFVTNMSQMELSDPGCPVHVVRVLADGTEENADQLVKLTIREPKDLVEIESTPQGLMIRPKKPGQTEIDATLGDLRTTKPFLVEVSPDTPRKPKMRVGPESLRIIVGQTSEFSKAEIVPPSGSAPVAIPFQVTTADKSTIEIRQDNSIRGLAPGTAVVKVTANDKEGKYPGMTCSATVEVVDPVSPPSKGSQSAKSGSTNGMSGQKKGDQGSQKGGRDPKAGNNNSKQAQNPSKSGNSQSNSGNNQSQSSQNGSTRGNSGNKAQPPNLTQELVLSGPSETNVGAEVQMQVELIVGRQSSVVTKHAELIMAAGDEKLAEVMPGGVIHAKAPGRIRVQARLNDLTSASQEILIRPIAVFDRLELELPKLRFGIGEVMEYQLWGYPRGGGARQNLTLLVTDDQLKTSSPQIRLKALDSSAPSVVIHQPGSLTGKRNGRFSMQAQLGDKLTSPVANLEVIGDLKIPDRIQIQPNRIEVFSGSDTPPIKVRITSPGDKNPVTLDSSLVALSDFDSEILNPKENGIFEAMKPGVTKIKVSCRGVEQLLPVTVKYNPFWMIEVGREPKFANSTLTVDLVVKAPTPPDDFQYQYRVVLPRINDRPVEETSWIDADKVGDQLVTKLPTPKMPIGQRDNHYYSVVIEARDLRTGKIDRRPYSFRIVSESGGGKVR